MDFLALDLLFCWLNAKKFYGVSNLDGNKKYSIYSRAKVALGICTSCNKVSQCALCLLWNDLNQLLLAYKRHCFSPRKSHRLLPTAFININYNSCEQSQPSMKSAANKYILCELVIKPPTRSRKKLMEARAVFHLLKWDFSFVGVKSLGSSSLLL